MRICNLLTSENTLCSHRTHLPIGCMSVQPCPSVQQLMPTHPALGVSGLSFLCGAVCLPWKTRDRIQTESAGFRSCTRNADATQKRKSEMKIKVNWPPTLYFCLSIFSVLWSRKRATRGPATFESCLNVNFHFYSKRGTLLILHTQVHFWREGERWKKPPPAPHF